MTDTYESYVNFLNKNREEIRDSMLIGEDSDLWKLYEKTFSDNFVTREVGDYNPGNFSATDSSEFVRELYNGKKLILIRAYAKTREVTASDFICEVINVSRDEIRNFTILLMEHTEHVATLKLLETSSPEIVLMDGSLVGRLRHKRNRIDAEKYQDFMDLYFRKLFELIRTCIGRNIPLVFIAKSSESSIFRRYLLERISKDGIAEDSIHGEKEAKRTDHLLIKSFAKKAGYTIPLSVQYPTFGEENEQKHLNVITLHAIPDATDLPVKVDVVVPEAQNQDKGKTIWAEIRESILDMVFWGYGGLKTHNIWLADVDREVKFTQKEIESLYMRTFEKVVGIPFYETRGERRARIRI